MATIPRQDIWLHGKLKFFSSFLHGDHGTETIGLASSSLKIQTKEYLSILEPITVASGHLDTAWGVHHYSQWLGYNDWQLLELNG